LAAAAAAAADIPQQASGLALAYKEGPILPALRTAQTAYADCRASAWASASASASLDQSWVASCSSETRESAFEAGWSGGLALQR